jgi:hypothetical protein
MTPVCTLDLDGMPFNPLYGYRVVRFRLRRERDGVISSSDRLCEATTFDRYHLHRPEVTLIAVYQSKDGYYRKVPTIHEHPRAGEVG